jgi:hypothetical protein
VNVVHLTQVLLTYKTKGHEEQQERKVVLRSNGKLDNNGIMEAIDLWVEKHPDVKSVRTYKVLSETEL